MDYIISLYFLADAFIHWLFISSLVWDILLRPIPF